MLRKNEFLFIWLGIIILLIILAAGRTNTSGVIGSLRLIFGCIFVLFIPGYVLLAVLLPGSTHIGFLERLSISFGLSLAVMAVIALILDHLPWGITLWPIVFSLTGFTLLATLFALYRRSRLPIEERSLIQSVNFISWWQMQSTIHRLALGAIVGTVFVEILGFTIMFSLPKSPITEFYILSPVGVADKYPSMLGEPITIRLGIINEEHRSVYYSIFVYVDGQPLLQTDPILIEDGQRWENNLAVAIPSDGIPHSVEYRLFRKGDITPYRSLKLEIQSQ